MSGFGKGMIYKPIVSVENLQLRKIAVKGRHILSTYTPERANFEDITCRRVSCGSMRFLRHTGNNKIIQIFLSQRQEQSSFDEGNLRGMSIQNIKQTLVVTLSWASKEPHFLILHGRALKEC